MSVVSRRSYEAFGLTVRTDIELPELSQVEQSSPEGADVVVERGTVEAPAGVDSGTVCHRSSSNEYYLLYPVADVLIADGCRIVVDPAQDTPHEVIRHLVIGPALNHLLHQRDFFVLHASAVELDGVAVAFVGQSGQGKTTTATAFLREGHRVLSDDVAAITVTHDGPEVRSGYPSIKLDPEVVERFKLTVEEPRRTCAARDRHFYGLCHEQPSEPVPLERIYLLEDGKDDQDGGNVEIHSPPPQEQLMELVANTYTTGVLGDDDEASANFSQCATLVGNTDVRRLHRPRNLDVLPAVVEAVTADVGR